MKIEIKKIGNSGKASFYRANCWHQPRAEGRASKLHVIELDRVAGFQVLSPYDPEFAKAMEIARRAHGS